ncbi:MAG: phosphotransferase [Clostridia bacterium]
MRERFDLKQVCQRYKARVIHMTPEDGFYLLETNRGPKELHIWPRVDVMRWSFAWREELARNGCRDVERFIRTRDAKPYVVMAKKGFTLTDHVPKADPLLTDAKQAAHCGSVVAGMHKAQQTDSFFTSEDVLRKEQLKTAEAVQRGREMTQRFVVQKTEWSKADEWVANQVEPTLQRMERSAELLAQIPAEEEWLTVSHRDLASENWGMWDGRMILRGFYRPVLSIQQRDSAGYLRELVTETGDTSKVDAFLDGYEQSKPLEYGEYQLLLACMVYPEETWKSIEEYVCKSPEEREALGTQQIETAIHRQNRVESVLGTLAERAERTRSGNIP